MIFHLNIERFSLESRKQLAFSLVIVSKLSDWLIQLAPLSKPIREPKPTVTRSHTFSRASFRLHVSSSSYDWSTRLSVSFVIGQSDYLGFGFTTLENCSICSLLLQEAFREAMNAHSAQLTKMRLPDRAVVLKAVSKAKNPILMKRKNMFKLR